ncbi:MAG: F0F1 ATP synthase subunit A [Candidatus Dormibacteraeota bacterium]|nr:F0F1 ATP synthase subunit A [Candidatus Dormibacteraeota bacterium]MBO0704044.1 F0F1 ATP synthase subunit A [Candidatus Dormibacteraeota bacterium]MBO0760159.1 F0F1 ATP synthase subunit A [Candidatus Dormibacteraeota bacterium]
MILLQEQAPGSFPTVEIGGCGNFCSFNYTSLLISGISIVLTIILVYVVAFALLRPGRPGKFQMIFELLYGYVRGLVRDSTAQDANFIVPLAMSIGLYILVANWIDFFPLDVAGLHPANSDLNQTLAMALVVIVVVQAYSVRVLGVRGYFRRFTKPLDGSPVLRTLFTPLNIIEEIVKPVTLSLRLFGNIFAGGVMVYLITLLLGAIPLLGPWVIGPFALIVWKLFDVFFIGSIQAFIFMLLTVIYFGQAREGLEEQH